MTRRLDEVVARAAAARALALANPTAPRAHLAAALGVSRGQLRHYLSGRMKGYDRPPWGDLFYSAAGKLAFADHAGAADDLSALVAMLRRPPLPDAPKN